MIGDRSRPQPCAPNTGALKSVAICRRVSNIEFRGKPPQTTVFIDVENQYLVNVPRLIRRSQITCRDPPLFARPFDLPSLDEGRLYPSPTGVIPAIRLCVTVLERKSVSACPPDSLSIYLYPTCPRQSAYLATCFQTC